jgi:hypothetical protein
VISKSQFTVRVEDGEFVIVADLPKRVKWDQSRLAAIVEEIKVASEDPSEYVAVEFKVRERNYAAWPSSIRSAFEPACTVETGKRSAAISARRRPRFGRIECFAMQRRRLAAC